MLLGHKIYERVAAMRALPAGIDQRSACRHPDWTGPDDLAIKILELREITDWQRRFVKVGATRTYYDVKLAVAAGADVMVVDGMQGGTAATQEVFIEHVGIPTLAAIPLAVQALQELGLHRRGPTDRLGRRPDRCGRREGDGTGRGRRVDRDGRADRAGGQLAAVRLRVSRAGQRRGVLRRLPGRPRSCRDHDAGPGAGRALRPGLGGRRVANYLRVLTLEAQTLARACGKSHVRNLEPEDLVALTIEAAAMARVPLAGTDWIPGQTADARGL